MWRAKSCSNTCRKEHDVGLFPRQSFLDTWDRFEHAPYSDSSLRKAGPGGAAFTLLRPKATTNDDNERRRQPPHRRPSSSTPSEPASCFAGQVRTMSAGYVQRANASRTSEPSDLCSLSRQATHKNKSLLWSCQTHKTQHPEPGFQGLGFGNELPLVEVKCSGDDDTAKLISAGRQRTAPGPGNRKSRENQNFAGEEPNLGCKNPIFCGP